MSEPDWLQFHTIASLFKDCKWKMYLELDGDNIAITYIKDVVFNANRQDVDTLRMTKVLSKTRYLSDLLSVAFLTF